MSKAWLFDTNCFIDIYKGRARIRPYFEDILAGQITPHMSAITEAELWRGLYASEVARHEALLQQFILLPLNSEAARLAGGWMQRFESRGLGWMDALITASAHMAKLPVLTRDKNLTQLLGNEAAFILYEA
jgi:predicted nucleic acid-binding protein